MALSAPRRPARAPALSTPALSTPVQSTPVLSTPSPSAPAPPGRPRLDPRVPVLDRVRSLQVGVDPSHGVVIDGATVEVRAALALLDGTRTLAEVAAGSGLAPDAAGSLVTALAANELLDPPGRRIPRVRLIGSGALARDIAEAICATGLGRLVVVDPEPAPAHVYAHPRATGGASLRAHLAGRGHEVDLAAHWFDGEVDHDVTVVADDRIEPDRALTQTLGREALPHLFVRPLVRGVVVGPLVLPGRTACTRCMDLVRARDSGWVGVLAQLCHRTLPTPVTPRTWAVGQVLVSLRAWAAGGHPATAGTTLELGRDWSVTTRAWPLHPLCGCADLAAAA